MDDEKCAAAATAAATFVDAVDGGWVGPVVDVPRNVGKLTYGATRHGSSGVDTGGLWLFNRIPVLIFKMNYRKSHRDILINLKCKHVLFPQDQDVSIATLD